VLYTLLTGAKDLRAADSLAVDVLVPGALGGRLHIATAVHGRGQHATPPVSLQAGWNTVVADLAGTWLPADERGRARQIDWVLTGASESEAGSVVFDNLRVAARSSPPREARREGIRLGPPPPGIARWTESWEQPLLWGAWAPGLVPELTAAISTHGTRGLRVPYDFTTTRRQVLYAAPAPAWDVRGVPALALDVYATPADAGAVRLSLALGGRAGRHESAAQPLRAGWNQVQIGLDGWLPAAARAAVDRIEWVVSAAAGPARGALVVDHFRSAP